MKRRCSAFDTRLDQRARLYVGLHARWKPRSSHVERPFGQTSLYDAVAETARAVAAEGPKAGTAAAAQRRRRADRRHRHAEPADARAGPGDRSSIDIPVYIVAVMSTIDDPRVREGPRARSAVALPDLARWTGGEMFMASAPAHASMAARQIVEELRHQYCSPSRRRPARAGGRWKIRARDSGLTVRARAGYSSGTGGVGVVSDPARLADGHSVLTRSVGHIRSEAKMKKLVLAVPVLALALGGTTACATKKMVQDANRGSERQSRNALEIRRGESGADTRQRRTHRRSRSEGRGCGRAARRSGRPSCGRGASCGGRRQRAGGRDRARRRSGSCMK